MYYSCDNNKNIRDDLTCINSCTSFDDGIQNLKRAKYDIIFIDPHHTFAQSKKDIETAYHCLLNDNGVIVIHDCYPTNICLVDEFYTGKPWCGLTYKAFIDFKNNNNMIQTYVVDCDFGCGIILKNKQRNDAYTLPDGLILDDVAKFDFFIKNAKSLLDLISPTDFVNIFK